MATFPSSDKRIFAREGRFGFELFAPLILLLAAEESASEGTPEVRGKKRKQVFIFMLFSFFFFCKSLKITYHSVAEAVGDRLKKIIKLYCALLVGREESILVLKFIKMNLCKIVWP